jgi:hypothetical protein
MKQIIQDCSDERALTILKNCRRAPSILALPKGIGDAQTVRHAARRNES